MADTVFILGAGSSKLAGAPIMNAFLRAIRDIHQSGVALEYSDDFEIVLNGYRLLRSVYSRLKMNYEGNIEELFASFEMIRLLEGERFLDFEVSSLSQAMKRVISATIEYTMRFPIESIEGHGPRLHPHQTYQDFVGLLFDIVNARSSSNPIAIITFNYDVGLDYALSHASVPYSYGIDNQIAFGDIPILKLHGSLNWSKCDECGKVIPIPLAQLVNYYPVSERAETSLFHISKQFKDLNKHEHQINPEPYIVPPTWNKTEYHSVISEVWKKAAAELAEARNIIICGYSLPETDHFFRHLLALSLISGTILDKVIVMNPDSSVATRFKESLSDNVLDVFEDTEIGFERIRGYINNQLGIPVSPTWSGRWTAILKG